MGEPGYAARYDNGQLFLGWADILHWISSCPKLSILCLEGLDAFDADEFATPSQLGIELPETLLNFELYSYDAPDSVYDFFWNCFPSRRSITLHNTYGQGDELVPIRNRHNLFHDLERLQLLGAGWWFDWPGRVLNLCPGLKSLSFELAPRLQWNGDWDYIVEMEVGTWMVVVEQGLETFYEALRIRRFPNLKVLKFFALSKPPKDAEPNLTQQLQNVEHWKRMEPKLREACTNIGAEMHVRGCPSDNCVEDPFEG
jgi:hypothetical protein